MAEKEGRISQLAEGVNSALAWQCAELSFGRPFEPSLMEGDDQGLAKAWCIPLEIAEDKMT